MNALGERLLNLRKEKKLSQEEVAEKLNVTRQTVSKWETDRSMPDFDKIVPLCELYGITPNELFIELEEKEQVQGQEQPTSITINPEEDRLETTKRAQGIAISIVFYFIAVIWIMISIPVLRMNPILASALFLLICGFATGIIVYVCIKYKKKKTEEESAEDKLRHQISEVVSIVVTILYLIISFATMAWHLTWIIWIIYALFDEILKLIFMLRSTKNEE